MKKEGEIFICIFCGKKKIRPFRLFLGLKIFEDHCFERWHQECKQKYLAEQKMIEQQGLKTLSQGI